MLTIRNLPDDVHARLRSRAAEAQVSVEGFVRRVVADATRERDRDVPAAGFAEASPVFTHAVAGMSDGALPELWGALRGSVLVAPRTDLTAAAGEDWAAEG